ncbi:hypothetical protein HY612_02985 [Candidatus Roizmanbacteria bacterium]|nr:hypothetical protein [Candidatus Roizmanbacteria bacterium]
MDTTQSQTPQPNFPLPPVQTNYMPDTNFSTPLSSRALLLLQKFKFLAPILPFFILLLIAAMLLFFANQQSPSRNTEEPLINPTSTPSPPASEDERELQAIDTGFDNKDFEDIQSDLKRL